MSSKSDSEQEQSKPDHPFQPYAQKQCLEKTIYKGFEFPSFYQLPPFFTIQPIPTTRQIQMQMWGALIHSFFRHFSLYELDVVESAATSPLFNNQNIQRRFCEEDIISCVDSLVEEGKAEWRETERRQNDKKDAAYKSKKAWIYWRTTREWGALVHEWATRLGKLNEVLTVYDVREGEDSENEEFFQLPFELMIKSLESLEYGGKAVVFSGKNSSAMGVKFFP